MPPTGLTTSPDDLVPIDYGSPDAGGWPVPRVRRRTAVFCVVTASAVASLLAAGGTGWLDGFRGRPSSPLPELDLAPAASFAFDERTGTINDVPAKFRTLDGQRVRVTGYMFSPMLIDDGPRPRVDCQLVYDTNTRSHAPPLVQERVFATLRKDLPLYDQYTLVRVVGRLRVAVDRGPANDWTCKLFRMEVESVTDVGAESSDSPR
jgi:hypothetical protein